MVELSKTSVKKLQEYDNIIFGAGVYGMKINGMKFLKKNISKLQGKRIYFFAVGGTPPETVDMKKLKSVNFDDESLKKIKLFYFRGGFDFSKLSPFYKIVMGYFKFKLKRKKEKTAEDKMMLQAYEAPLDFSSRKETKALTRVIKNY